MEFWILQVVVVEGDEEREAHKRDPENGGERGAARVGEGHVAHETGGVDHGELVDELHWVFQRRVEQEAPRTHEQVSDEGYDKNLVMVLLEAGSDAAVAEVHEEEVREGVDYLGGVVRHVVVLLFCNLLVR